MVVEARPAAPDVVAGRPPPAGRDRRCAGANAALAVVVLCTVAIVVYAASGPSPLVSRSATSFPAWEAGPLHGLVPRLTRDPVTVDEAASGVLAAMTIAYAVLLRGAGGLSRRSLVAGVVVLHAILLLGPPLLLSDLLNYLGFARLEAVHGLNPYRSPIAGAPLDPILRMTTWHHLRSPYGELFTAVSAAIATLPLAVAFWVLKTITVGLSLVTLALVWRCARRLGRDPVAATAFVAFNPLFLIYAVGGFHNDFFMVMPVMAAIAWVLAGRDRAAGIALAAAVAAKLTAVVVAPFLVLAAATAPRRRRLLSAAVLAVAAAAAGSVALYGATTPNLRQQSSLLTNQSVPNLVTWLTGLGGAGPLVLGLADVAVVAVLAWQLLRRRHWVTGAGWTTLALILSLGWIMPWYVVWLLPLAAIGPSARLRAASLVLTVYLLVAFWPVTPVFLARHHIDPLATSVGRHSRALERHLAH